uniref:Uncharacterized protein n=2 Tax=Magallana gigas TaxID=29159 RepID=A0A8W8LFY1_MAGGI|eukprot:XP_011434306.1 PREDICTED: uncharacterized protein LOC105333164 [Crassostrea gigas]
MFGQYQYIATMSHLSNPLERLEFSFLFSLSSLKLKLCDAGVGDAICFTKACVRVVTMSSEMYAFTEIFDKGHRILLEYITQDKKPMGTDLHLLQKLISFTSNLKDASKALQSASGGSGGKERETEWSERLAVHFFLPLSLAQDCVLDISSNDKVLECPCSCKFPIMYGDTSIGHPKTWFGNFDIVIRKASSPQERNKRPKLETEVHIAATVIPEEFSQDPESLQDESSEDDLTEFDSLQKYFSQTVAQSIVFSFYQKKCNQAVNIVPFIAVSKTHVQFHFYDCEKDLYFLSQEMPLFAGDCDELLMETVIATWLVINYRYLLSGPTEEMVRGEKFGFHSNVSDEALNLYRNEIKMGITKLKTKDFDVRNALWRQGVFLNASDTVKRKKKFGKEKS